MQGPTPRVDAQLRAAFSALAHEGLTAGIRLLVGVSGGQDSLCLVHALWRLRAEHRWALHVVHVDHGIRAAAAGEAARVAATCSAWGLPVAVLRVDVPAYRRRERLSVQEAARYARYQAFAHCASVVGAAAVLVAHTADDIAETLLLHLIRGAGLDGLAAMPRRQVLPRAALGPPLDERPLPPALVVARPLLTVARADTAAYCAEQGLVPFGEPAGAYRRDRVRAELLPLLERHNPRARRALAGAAFALAEERAALAYVVEELWASLARREGDEIIFALDRWQALPTALKKRLLRRGVAELGGAEVAMSRRVLAAALDLAGAQSGRGIDLPRGLHLAREPGALRLTPAPPSPSRSAGVRRDRGASTEPRPLPVPGRAVLPGIGMIRAERRAAPPAVLPPAHAPECWLDAASLGAPMAVRLRRPGDRFQPLGMAQAKRLQDFLVDARVPRRARDHLPLVACGDAIAWVVGQRIAEWARVRPDSQAVLHLVFEPAAEPGAGAAVGSHPAAASAGRPGLDSAEGYREAPEPAAASAHPRTES